MSDAAVEVHDLVKTFDLGFLGALPGIGPLFSRLQLKGIAQRVEAVRGVSLRVEPGEIFGFLGPNGAGKTTTIKMLMGLIRPTSGTASILGRPLGDREARARLGFLPEHPYFYDYLKPIEFLDFYGRLFRIDARERRRRAEALVDRVGLRHAVNRPLRKFSKGMVQRIGIAQALINDPDLVVLDEPMSGLDPMGRKDVRDLIFALKEQGKTVFFSSHILQDVEALCDRVAIMARGRLRSIGPLHTLLGDEVERIDVSLANASPELVARLTPDGGEPRTLPGLWVFSLPGTTDVGPFIQGALAGGARLVSVVPHRRSLETLFVEAARDAEGDA
ncbi:MAG: ABC transporter ATP-binding protein [bacterium]